MLYGVKFGGQTDLAFSGHMVFLGLAFWHWESEVIYMSRLFDTTRGRLVGDFFVQVEFVAFQIPRQSGRAGLLWDTYRRFLILGYLWRPYVWEEGKRSFLAVG